MGLINYFFDFHGVDQLLFRFSICGYVPEIFAIKVESCKKSRKNFDVFLTLPNFRGQAFHKLYPGYNPGVAARRVDKKNCDNIPISSELIDVYTLNFKPNFTFSRLNNFWGTPVPVGVCANKA